MKRLNWCMYRLGTVNLNTVNSNLSLNSKFFPNLLMTSLNIKGLNNRLLLYFEFPLNSKQNPAIKRLRINRTRPVTDTPAYTRVHRWHSPPPHGYPHGTHRSRRGRRLPYRPSWGTPRHTRHTAAVPGIPCIPRPGTPDTCSYRSNNTPARRLKQ